MINTNDLSKIAFFPEKDQKKIENQVPFFADSVSFLTALQTVSEETSENSFTKSAPYESEGTNQIKPGDIQPPENKGERTEENQVFSSQRMESSEEETILDDITDSEDSIIESEKHYTSSIKSEGNKEEKSGNKQAEGTIPSNGLGIASMLLPSFQKESNGLEIFQDKLLSGNPGHSQTPKNLFPKKSELKDTGDLLKSVFISQKKTHNEKDTGTRESTSRDKKETKEALIFASQNVKQLLDELKNQTSKSPKAEEKGMESAKSILNPSMVELLDPDGFNEKKLKSNKKKIEESKGFNTSQKKGTESIGSEKISSKDQGFISKNSKEDTTLTTITDKLKRTEVGLKREKNPEIVSDGKNETHLDIKTTDKNSPSPMVFEPKQRMNDAKLEVKSIQKQDSLGQNFKEIVKAAKFHIVENGKNTAEISLQPKDLGKVTLYVSEENNRMEGRITVESESVRQMILGELAHLKADLKASGLDLFEIQVDLQQEMYQPFAKGEDSEERRNTETYSEYSQEMSSEDESQDLSSETATVRLLDLKV